MSHRTYGASFLCSHSALGGSGAKPFALPGDEPQYFRARPFALTSLRVELQLDWEARAVHGDAELTLERLDREARWAEVDAVGFEDLVVERPANGGWAPAAFRYDEEVLRVDLSDVGAGENGKVRVRYRATPARGLYFVGPDDAHPERPRQVWTQCQDQDGRHWFPCQDHPGQRMRTDFAVTVPKGMFALGNGVLVERMEREGGERFRWRQEEPHPAYLVTLVVGRFEAIETEADGVPVAYYVPADRLADVERSFGRTPEMIRLYAEKLRTPYPWAKYAQVVVSDFIFGGMENTSATTMVEHILMDERAALDADMESLVAHELAHQWFGNLVTCRQWTHAWLNEGFATYLEAVWKEHADGRDEYLYSLEQDLDLYLTEVGGRYARPVVTRTYAAPLDVFDRHLYQKGGLILHALREHLGDEAFWRGVAAYLSRHRGTGVETRDLLRAEDVRYTG